ncbi:transporter [Flavobacterium sp. F372]|uniref:Transporter n=1 Tax=Flavobacterium bernardetii TaxID=2813823 RepID=A0ABR7IYA3_9FLAO|nr:transporter [Flavobacterium bernardetii]MBC5834771.1 transporter [Flavobacterium bernardetii]NHF70419.1 transporter [Flavobacterium bernardetii]
MKKILLSLLIGGSFMANAQEPTITDALRYSVENLNGTARFRAMGGAFGSIGGDMSAININPAGSSVFNYNQATISLSSFNKSNNAGYFGTNTTTKENSLDINQLGAVFVFNDNNAKSGWKKFALGLNYENTNNFDDFIISEGVNPYNSMDKYFLRFANVAKGGAGNLGGTYYEDLGFIKQQAWLGYNSYLLDYNSGGNNYTSNVPTGGNYYHKNTIEANGYNGKFTINFSGAYEDKLYLGMNMNFHFTDYVRTSSLYESNNNPVSNTLNNYAITAVRFNNELYTYGSGFALNLGAIYKATENIRVGLAYETPTWYKLNDELTQSISTAATNGSDNFDDYVNPNIVNIYPTYKIQTPSKLTASGTVLFGKKGLLSVDYISRNYAKTQFKPKNEEIFSSINNQMKNELQDNYELRVGGEYKIQKWSVRGGYRFEQSPYKTDLAFGDLMSYSGGLGYNFGNSKLDISYTNEHRARTEVLLTSGLNDPARIKNYNNNVTLTYVVNF